MTNNQNPNRKKANGLLWASRIFASIVVAFFSLFIIPDIIAGITRGSFLPAINKWEGVIMTIWYIILLIGYILSWIKEGLGGVIMILAGLTVTLPLIIFSHNYGSLISGIPSIVAGSLFLIYWRDMRRKKLSGQSL
jgi:hypothetical protein